MSGVTGLVVAGDFGAGTKSARKAVWIQTSDQRLVLRRKDGPTYGDRQLEKYIGKRVRCDGFTTGYMLLAEKIEVEP